MQKLLLLGNEALAQGVLDAGVSGVYAYPGTPSTEITEYIKKSSEAKERNIHNEWSANEKTAYEAALGMSYTGKRTMVSMKHVGLNVAADPFMNSALTGVNGGMIVTVADDPSMHSSQNEQDSRFFGKYAMIPILEPGNQQEAYDMAFYAFQLSEKFRVPVMIRFTTRLAHSRAGIVRKSTLPEKEIKLPEDPLQYVMLPGIARRKYKLHLEMQKDFLKESEASSFNQYIDGTDKKIGIIACGLAYNYLMENYQENGCPYPILKVSQYPLPYNYVEKLTKECDTILVLEEGAPIVEEMLRGFLNKPLKIKGRMDGSLPRDGELNPNLVRIALGMDDLSGEAIPEVVTARPPKLCLGCPHIDSYNALKEVMEDYGNGHVFADIGCYTLGALPPYRVINSCVDMGASITMAKGAADAGLFPSIAVIGDSTFTHSGMTGLLDAVNEKSNIVVLILDNHTTAMTGGQDSPGFGKLEEICIGIGVEKEHIRVVNPLSRNHAEIVQVLKEELAYEGVSVIIPRRECVQTMTRRMRKE
ncbi:MAG: thiamine pyrophosphate-dependent enzyme [Candidatus Cloacimonas sp.]|nr:thiamine pyrophosphate-dependent enzyme [Candidatus Cloacimonadota bacterium]